MPSSGRHTIAEHFFSQSRFQRRHEQNFERAAEHLPPEAGAICDTVREGRLQPEIMAVADYLRTVDNARLDLHTTTVRSDIVEVARLNARQGDHGREERTRAAALARSVRDAEKSGLFSQASERANREIFKCGALTAGAEIMLIGPAAVTAERKMQRGSVVLEGAAER